MRRQRWLAACAGGVTVVADSVAAAAVAVGSDADCQRCCCCNAMAYWTRKRQQLLIDNCRRERDLWNDFFAAAVPCAFPTLSRAAGSADGRSVAVLESSNISKKIWADLSAKFTHLLDCDCRARAAAYSTHCD